MSDNVFLKIIRGEIPVDALIENDHLIAFRDIQPQAPVHILIVPKKPVATVNDLEPGDAELVGRMVLAARDLAEREGLAAEGYRLVLNCNEAGGQSVYQLHLHLLAGRRMGWPPG